MGPRASCGTKPRIGCTHRKLCSSTSSADASIPDARRETMIDHTGVAVTNIAKSKAFYRAALAPLGYAVIMEFDDAAGLGAPPKPDFWIGKASQAETPIHIAFRAESRAQVDAFHK